MRSRWTDGLDHKDSVEPPSLSGTPWNLRAQTPEWARAAPWRLARRDHVCGAAGLVKGNRFLGAASARTAFPLAAGRLSVWTPGRSPESRFHGAPKGALCASDPWGAQASGRLDVRTPEWSRVARTTPGSDPGLRPTKSGRRRGRGLHWRRCSAERSCLGYVMAITSDAVSVHASVVVRGRRALADDGKALLVARCRSAGCRWARRLGRPAAHRETPECTAIEPVT